MLSRSSRYNYNPGPNWRTYDPPQKTDLPDNVETLMHEGPYYALYIPARGEYAVTYWLVQEFASGMYLLESSTPGGYWKRAREELLAECHLRAEREAKLRTIKQDLPQFYRDIYQLAESFLKDYLKKYDLNPNDLSSYLEPDFKPNEASLSTIYRCLLRVAFAKNLQSAVIYTGDVEDDRIWRDVEFVIGGLSLQEIAMLDIEALKDKWQTTASSQDRRSGYPYEQRNPLRHSDKVPLIISEAAKMIKLFNSDQDFYQWLDSLLSRSLRHPLYILIGDIQGLTPKQAQDFLLVLGYSQYWEANYTQKETIDLCRDLGIVSAIDSDEVVSQVLKEMTGAIGVRRFAIERLLYLITSSNFYKHEDGRKKLEKFKASEFVNFVEQRLGYEA